MKKQVKGILCLAVLATMLSGCGGSTGDASSSASSAGSSAAVSSTPAASSSSSSSSSSASSSAASSEVDASDVQRGTWTDNVYTNDYAGLSFTNPEGWTAYTDEQLASQMGLAAESMENLSDFQKSLVEQAAVYDMMTVDAATNSNVIIMYENTFLETGTKSTTPEEYLNSVASMLPTANSGVGYEIGDIAEATVGGNTYSTLTTTASANGVSLTQVYYVRKSGDFMVDIIVTAANGTQVEDIMANFK